MSKYEIQPLFNSESKTYEIANFDETKQALLEKLSTAPINLIIENDGDFKAVKNYRTEIRKDKDAITKTRLAINDLLLSTFNNQLKDLEKTIDEVDKQLKAKVDEHKAKLDSEVPSEPIVQSYSIKVVSPNQEDLDKVSAFALKLKCQVIK